MGIQRTKARALYYLKSYSNWVVLLVILVIISSLYLHAYGKQKTEELPSLKASSQETKQKGQSQQSKQKPSETKKAETVKAMPPPELEFSDDDTALTTENPVKEQPKKKIEDKKPVKEEKKEAPVQAKDKEPSPAETKKTEDKQPAAPEEKKPDKEDKKESPVQAKDNAPPPAEPQTPARTGGVDGRACRKALPNCIIAGVEYARGRTITNHLAVHPEIVLLPCTSFFIKNYDRGLAWYKDQMPCTKPGQVVAELCFGYFTNLTVPDMIYKVDKNMKILIIVRDPVKRTLEHYQYVKRKNIWPVKSTFADEVLDESGNVDENDPLIMHSEYHSIMKKWQDVFRSNIYITEELTFKHNVESEFTDIERFLGLPSTLASDHVLFDKKRNKYCLRETAEQTDCGTDVKPQNLTAPRKERINSPIPLNSTQLAAKQRDEEAQKKLREHFDPHNEKLYEMVGRRFKWN